MFFPDSNCRTSLYVIPERAAKDSKSKNAFALQALRDFVNIQLTTSLLTICEADTIIDFGPGGGMAGGHIVAIGTIQEVAGL